MWGPGHRMVTGASIVAQLVSAHKHSAAGVITGCGVLDLGLVDVV